MILTRLERSILRELAGKPQASAVLGSRLLAASVAPAKRRYRMLMKLGRMRVRGLVRSVGSVNGDSVWSLTEKGRAEAGRLRKGVGVGA
jgi:hypothetical protein